MDSGLFFSDVMEIKSINKKLIFHKQYTVQYYEFAYSTCIKQLERTTPTPVLVHETYIRV